MTDLAATLDDATRRMAAERAVRNAMRRAMPGEALVVLTQTEHDRLTGRLTPTLTLTRKPNRFLRNLAFWLASLVQMIAMVLTSGLPLIATVGSGDRLIQLGGVGMALVVLASWVAGVCTVMDGPGRAFIDEWLEGRRDRFWSCTDWARVKARHQ